MTKKIRLYQPFGDPGCQRPEIQNAPLSPDDMAGFVTRSNEIMMMLMKQEAQSEEKTEEKSEDSSEE